MLGSVYYVVIFGDVELGSYLTAVSLGIQTPFLTQTSCAQRTRPNLSSCRFPPSLKEMGRQEHLVSRVLGCSALPSTVQEDP